MKRYSRFARTAAPIAALTLMLAACTSDEGEEGTSSEPTTSSSGESTGAATSGQVAGSVLTVNWGGFPENWTPGAEMEAGFMRVPYENLVVKDAAGTIQPYLVTAWEQDDSSLTLTLRDDVTFHDGTPFNAEAVKVNIETVQNTPGPYAGTFSSVTSIDVDDEYMVTLNLSEPTPSLLTAMATRALPIASPTAIADGSIATTPVGTGPWMYDEAASVTGTRMSFGPNADYWGDLPGFETIQLVAIDDDTAASAALANGEIDVTDTEANQLSTLDSAGNISHLAYPALRNNPMFFDRGPGGMFEDVEVRQAFCYALDTVTLSEIETDWKPMSQHFVEGESGYNADIVGYENDVAMAQELYDGAGNPPVDAEMMSTVFNTTQMQLYADQVSEIGMTVSVTEAPPPQYFSEWNSGAYPLGLGSNDEQTAYDWYKAWFAADAPGNPSGVESDALKAAADAAIAAGTSAEADALWGEVTKVISDEALTCAHVAGDELVAWNDDTVSGAAAPTETWETNLINYRDLRPVE
ncbi:ABC transporter substrate-binding protein [Demequina sp. NBRC 110051]|uniref:ABC transporter substrate-binding protein n=1 Tax=Demequina sp. NBRC 110051 TaxID=1570340 RepID=UPI000A02EC58|nr:ABC transporter substrate-binding protein [Demequina sp. NBRC 110051]